MTTAEQSIVLMNYAKFGEIALMGPDLLLADQAAHAAATSPEVVGDFPIDAGIEERQAIEDAWTPPAFRS